MFTQLSLGEFHPVLIHLPIALVIIGFIFDLLSWILVTKREQFLTLGHWFFLFAAILIIPTAFTGWYATDFYPATDPDVYRHAVMAVITAVYLFGYGVFRACCLYTKQIFSIYLYVILSLIAVILIGVTAELGGIVVRGKGIFLQSAREPGYPLPYNQVKRP